MKTFNKLISFAIISMTNLTYTACSDGFFDRYPTDSMQMETYLKNDAELQNILLNGYYHLQDITLNVNYVRQLYTILHNKIRVQPLLLLLWLQIY